MLKQTNHSPVSNQQLITWVRQMSELCQPECVHWCAGCRKEAADVAAYHAQFGPRLPMALSEQLGHLRNRLG